MNEIIGSANKLAEEIKSGFACREYNDARKALLSHPELYEAVSKYKEALLRFNMDVMDGGKAHLLDFEKNLSRMRQELSSSEVTNCFLECEKNLLSQLETVYNIIGSACNIDFFGN